MRNQSLKDCQGFIINGMCGVCKDDHGRPMGPGQADETVVAARLAVVPEDGFVDAGEVVDVPAKADAKGVVDGVTLLVGHFQGCRQGRWRLAQVRSGKNQHVMQV